MQLVTVHYGNDNSQWSFWHLKSVFELKANKFVLHNNLYNYHPSLGTTAVHKRWLRRAASFLLRNSVTLTQARWMFFLFITPLPCRQLKNSCSLFPPRRIDLLWYKKLSCWHANFLLLFLNQQHQEAGMEGCVLESEWWQNLNMKVTSCPSSTALCSFYLS